MSILIPPHAIEALMIFFGILFIDGGYWCQRDGQGLVITVIGLILVSVGIALVLCLVP